MKARAAPVSANWDITYACQLRCGYCYTESGRRAAGTLPQEAMLRIAETLGSLGLKSVQISGGEPLLIRGLPEIVERIRAKGTAVALYTNGLLVDHENIDELCRLFAKIHVSVDGATAEVHDKIRARVGSFEGAMSALETLDRAVSEGRAAGKPCPRFGIDTVLIRSNFHQIEAICTDLTRRFSHMSFLNLGAAVPSGLATGTFYSKRELLTPAQIAQLRDPAFAAKTRALLPVNVDEYSLSDNFVLAMDPQRMARGEAAENLMHVEADGGVRSMAIYEGTVGNILDEPVDVLWERVLAARQHPVVLDALSSIDTMEEWADAARRIDLHFASDANRRRIHLRMATQTGVNSNEGTL